MGMRIRKDNIIGLLFSLFAGGIVVCTPAMAQKGKKSVKTQPPFTVRKDGKLVYNAADNGDRIPDFSYCGYMASEQSIPFVPVRVVVPLKKGDATLRIQAALDYVASLPEGSDGFRGAVLLNKGVYEAYGNLKIKAAGVILRGSGMGSGGTVLLGAGKDRSTLIAVSGVNDKNQSKEINITDPYVPVNSISFHVADAADLKTGDKIMIHRPSTQNWIAALGTDHFGGDLTALAWKPGERDIFWGQGGNSC